MIKGGMNRVKTSWFQGSRVLIWVLALRLQGIWINRGTRFLGKSLDSELPEMQSNAVRRVIFGVVHANITYPFWYLIKDIGSHCIRLQWERLAYYAFLIKQGGSDATPQNEIYMGLRPFYYYIFVKLSGLLREKVVWGITEMHYNGLWGVTDKTREYSVKFREVRILGPWAVRRTLGEGPMVPGSQNPGCFRHASYPLYPFRLLSIFLSYGKSPT